MADPTPRPGRRQQRRQETIGEILAAARRQMRAEGAAALNLSDLARAVGMRTPSLYEYFPGGKYAIYDALFAYGFEQFGEAMRQVYAQAEEPWETLQHSLEVYFRFAAENPELFQLCFERPVPGFVPSEASLKLSFGVLDEGRIATEGLLRKLGNPIQLSIAQVNDLIVAVTHGITALHLANEPQLPLGEGRFGSLIPVVVELFQRAWAAAPPWSAKSEGGSE